MSDQTYYDFLQRTHGYYLDDGVYNELIEYDYYAGDEIHTNNVIFKNTAYVTYDDTHIRFLNKSDIHLYDTSGIKIYDSGTFTMHTSASPDARAFVVDSIGRVGIGMVHSDPHSNTAENPGFDLHVRGTVGIEDYMYHNDDTDTYMLFGSDQTTHYVNMTGGPDLNTTQDFDEINFRVGGVDMLQMLETDTGNSIKVNKNQSNVSTIIRSETNESAMIIQGDGTEVVINDTEQSDTNFRVKSSGTADIPEGHGPHEKSHAFFVDTETGRVGIGKSSPDTTLHVAGSAHIDGDLWVKGVTNQIDTLVHVTSAMDISNMGTGPALIVNQTGSQPVATFRDDGSDILYIEDLGNVGFQTGDPHTSVYINDHDGIRIPVGVTSERPLSGAFGITGPADTADFHAMYGTIRYNTEYQTFEGFGPGNAWGSLGGVIDIDRDTFWTALNDISGSDYPGDPDQLRAYVGNDNDPNTTNGTLMMTIDLDRTVVHHGKMGIKTIDPKYTLHVEGGGYFAGEAIPNIAPDNGVYLGQSAGGADYHVSIIAPTNKSSYIDFSNTSRDAIGRILYANPDASITQGMHFFANYNGDNNGADLFIDPSGNVGIGTILPQRNLDIYDTGGSCANRIWAIADQALGTSSMKGAWTEYAVKIAPGPDAAYLTSDDVPDFNYTIGIDSTDADTGSSNINHPKFKFGYSYQKWTSPGESDITIMALQPDGNVGIGIDDPSHRLTIKSGEVSGHAGAGVRLVGRPGNDNHIRYDCPSMTRTGSSGTQTASNDVDYWLVGVDSTGGLSDDYIIWNSDRNNVDLTINHDDGNVGINTNEPDAMLTIGNLGPTNDVKMLGFGEGEKSTIFFASGFKPINEHNYLELASTSTPNIMTWTMDGRVGVNVEVPKTNLHLHENSSTVLENYTQAVGRAGVLIQTSYTSGTYTPGVFWNTSNNVAEKPKVGVWTYMDGNGSKLHLGTSNNYDTGITNRAITIDPSGNVGINDTTPSHRLDVNGSIRSTGWFRNSQDDTGLYNETNQNHFASVAVDTWAMNAKTGSDNLYLRLQTNGWGGTIRGYLAGTHAGVGILDDDKNWAIMAITDDSVKLRVNNADVFTAGAAQVTGSYGTVQTHGSGKGNWEGYSINGRAVFMHNGGTETGIYNDVNNHWMLKAFNAGRTGLYHNGSEKLRTTSDGAETLGTMYINDSSNRPGLVINSGSSGDGWANQGCLIGLGESANKAGTGTAALYLTYNGNGNSWIGTGGVNSNGVPNKGYIQFSYSSNSLYFSANPSIAGSTNWHSGNDGSGSGLDADLLDGLQSGSYLRSDVTDTFSGSALLIDNPATNGYGNVEISGKAGAFIDLKRPNTDDYDLRLITTGTGGAIEVPANTSFATTVAGVSITTVSNGGLNLDTGGISVGGTTVVDSGAYVIGARVSGTVPNADTVDSLHASSFARSDADDTITGLLTMSRSGECLRLRGSGASTSPYLSFYQYNPQSFSAVRRAYIQYNHSTYTLNLYNDVYDNYLAIGSDGSGLVWHYGGTGYTVWHKGNDGSSSGLDADLLDGLHASSFLRSGTNITVGNNSASVEGGEVLLTTTSGTTGYSMDTFKDVNNIYKHGSNRWLWRVFQGTGSGIITFDATSGSLRVSGDVVAFSSSDSKYKDNLTPISDALNKTMSLTGYEFDWNNKQTVHSGHDVGVVAQEVEQVLPEIVETREDDSKAVRYEKMIPLLIESIKEQQSQIDALKAEIEQLKQQ